jgi:hypothetical protein
LKIVSISRRTKQSRYTDGKIGEGEFLGSIAYFFGHNLICRFPIYEQKSGYGATALLSRQTANKDYQSSHIILAEFLSECRHFAFNPV